MTLMEALIYGVKHLPCTLIPYPHQLLAPLNSTWAGSTNVRRVTRLRTWGGIIQGQDLRPVCDQGSKMGWQPCLCEGLPCPLTGCTQVAEDAQERQ